MWDTCRVVYTLDYFKYSGIGEDRGLGWAVGRQARTRVTHTCGLQRLVISAAEEDKPL